MLDGRARPITVSLFGRALAAQPDGGAQTIVPLRRISHVTARGQVVFSAEALLGCAACGRPVGLLDQEARLKALVLPVGRRRTPLSEALDRLRRRRDWPERLDDWRRSRISWAARGIVADPAVAVRAGWAGAELLITAASGVQGRGRRQRLAHLLRSHALLAAARALADAGCPSRWMSGAPDERQDLVPIFGQIALWRIARLAVRSRGAWRLRSMLRADASRDDAKGLARSAAMIDRPLRNALVREAEALHRWLVEVAGAFSDWPGWEGTGR